MNASGNPKERIGNGGLFSGIGLRVDFKVNTKFL
jgi:hypothetical protein